MPPAFFYVRPLWLGLWTPHLLQTLLPPSHPMSRIIPPHEQAAIHNIITTLTEPLLAAYKQMLAHALGRPVPPTLSPCPYGPTAHQLAALHPQDFTRDGPGLHNLIHNDSTCFHIANVSFEDAATGIW